MKCNEPNLIHWDGYSFEEKSNIEMKEVYQTMDERVAHIFELLNIALPTEMQQRFARFEIKYATERGNFKKLVFLIAGLMGKLDEHYDSRYILKLKE